MSNSFVGAHNLNMPELIKKEMVIVVVVNFKPQRWVDEGGVSFTTNPPTMKPGLVC